MTVFITRVTTTKEIIWMIQVEVRNITPQEKTINWPVAKQWEMENN